MSDLLLMASRGLPRNGLVLLADPYRDAYGLDATARAALQTGVDYSGRGNTLTYGATTNASTDDPTNTGTAWSFGGDDFMIIPGTLPQSLSALSVVWVGKPTNTGARFRLLHGGVSLFLSPNNNTGYLRSVSTDTATAFTAPDYTDTTVCLVDTLDIAGKQHRLFAGGLPVVSTTCSNFTQVAYPSSGIMAYLGDAGTSKYTGDVELFAVYNRVFQPIETMRIYRYLKSLMAGRGVTVA